MADSGLFFLHPVRNEMNGIVDRPNKNVEVKLEQERQLNRAGAPV
jgi:hypothetical protein